MQRLPWTRLDMEPGGLPNCFILIPENDAERADLRRSFEAVGVNDRLSFCKSSVNGCIHLPAALTWEADGAVPVELTVEGTPARVTAWFWLVEWNDGSLHRSAWWSRQHSRNGAKAW